MNRSLAMRSLRAFMRDNAGTTAIEYAVIATGIACAIIAVVTGLGTEVNAMFVKVSTALN